MFTEYMKKRMQDLLGYGLAMEGLAPKNKLTTGIDVASDSAEYKRKWLSSMFAD